MKKKTFDIFLLSLAIDLFLLSRIATGQTLASGPQVLTFCSDIDDTEQPYGLYLPEHYDPAKKYPLVIMLHGAGSNHRLALRRVFGKSNANGETDVEATRYFPAWDPIEFIVASPYARGTMGYQGIAEKDVYDVLADVEKRFSIDRNRVYLTGLSMGGGGTLWLGLTRPDLWAAIAPVCPAPPQGTIDLAGNALNFPVEFFQGGADPVVKPEGTRNFAAKMKELGVNADYNEVPGVQHNVWENAYKDEFMFHWFAKYTRNNFPERVTFATRQMKYNQAYWVTLNRMVPDTLAKIDVKFNAKNELEIATQYVNAFTLHLAGHPMFNPGRVQMTVDGNKIKADAADSITLIRQGKKWVTGQYREDPGAKNVRLEGPVAEAFSGRHVYVYGTSDNPTRDVMMKRAEVAQTASNWSVYRGEFLGRVMVFPRTLADKEVRPSDYESANFILFGNKETNSIIAKFSEQLPFSLKADSVGYGLLFIYPVSGHYVVVNSGLPWWTGAHVQGMPFIQPTLRLLSGFKDFILFKGSVKNVVAEGFFDANWKLSDQDKEALRGSGVIDFNK